MLKSLNNWKETLKPWTIHQLNQVKNETKQIQVFVEMFIIQKL